MTISAPPPLLRWVVPATVAGALSVIVLLLMIQHHHSRFEDAGPAASAAPSDVYELSAWLGHAAPLVASLRAAFGEVGEAAMASDYDRTSAACRSGLELTGALVAELPSPDVTLNDGLRRALDDYEQALSHCVTGSENNDPAELAMAADLVSVGDRHWRAAVGTIDMPWPGLPPSVSRPSHVFKI